MFQRIREAIEEDDSETVSEILCMGLSPNTTYSSSISENNQSLLHEAAKHDSIDSATVSSDSQEGIFTFLVSLDVFFFRFLLNSEPTSKKQMDSPAVDLCM